MGRKKIEVLSPPSRVDDVLFDVTRFELGNQDVFEHGHTCIELTFVVAGTAIHVFDGIPTRARSGSVFLLRPGDTHSFEQADSLTLFNVSCAPDMLESFGVSMTFLRGNEKIFSGEAPGSRSLILNALEQYDARKLLEEMLAEFNAPGSQHQAKLRSLFTLLLVLLARAAERDPDHAVPSGGVEAAAAFLETHYLEPVTLDQLAGIAFLSPSQLIRVFRKRYGDTPIARQLKLRLEHACRLLNTGRLSIAETAYRSGFSDSNYFIRQFRKHYGVTPGRFRA